MSEVGCDAGPGETDTSDSRRQGGREPLSGSGEARRDRVTSSLLLNRRRGCRQQTHQRVALSQG